MRKLTRESLLSLEQYALERDAFRTKVMAHKKARRVAVGPHATLYFEDALTMQYQVQEMLRIERIFESDQIQDELDAYNPLVPDGTNLKATLKIEYPDVAERRAALERLLGIERTLWLQVGTLERVAAVANEDLERETDEKTSAVHFVRFELTRSMIDAFSSCQNVHIGIDHPAYRHESRLEDISRAALSADLDDQSDETTS